MADNTVKIDDTRKKKLFASLKKKPYSLQFGVLAKDGTTTYPGSSITIGEVAFWNEVGTEGSPARSWLASWVNENKKDILKDIEKAYVNVLFKDKSEEAELNKLGKKYVAAITQKIKDRIPPPNSDITVALKGSDIPLIDTGLLLATIKHEVTK